MSEPRHRTETKLARSARIRTPHSTHKTTRLDRRAHGPSELGTAAHTHNDETVGVTRGLTGLF